MSEMQTSAAQEAATQPGGAPRPAITHEQKQKRRNTVRRIITALILLALAAAVVWALWHFVFSGKKSGPSGEPIYDTAMTGSIVSTVSGYGTANAKDSATITLSQSGTVEEVYVTQGQVVYEGDPLYVISSTDAQKAVEEAKKAYDKQLKSMEELQEQMDSLMKKRGELIITVPHDGKLIDVGEFKMGDPLTSGVQVARVVDDTKLKLSLYYSYAYENDIYVGQSASVSVPATMTTLTGTVEKINKVRMITPEGGVNFEVVFVVDNPGTMTEGMAASAFLTNAAGEPMYPYNGGKFTYYQTTTITTKAAGPIEGLAELLNYADVKTGDILLIQGTNDVEEEIRTLRETMATARETLEKAELEVETKTKDLDNFSAVAPISGTVVVLSPQMVPGSKVEGGLSAITIADNAVMTVNISVDDRNRQYINVGDTLEFSDWNGNSYMGIVDSLAVIGENQNGVTVYPGIVRVDNPSGSLMGGYGLNYSFTSAQSLDCVVIPIADVRYYSPEGSTEPQPVVYIKTSEEREDAIDKQLLPADMQEKIPKECIVVPVELGLSDTYNVEIISGVQPGELIYNNTPSADGNYWN